MRQRDLIERFGSSTGRRFEGLDWLPARSGGPGLPGVLMRIHCTVEQVHVAGDHDVVIGRVVGARGRRVRSAHALLPRSAQRDRAPHPAGGDDGAEPLDDYWG